MELPVLNSLVTNSTQLQPGIIADCNQLFFRQSMINDYALCPMMALYRWVIGTEESAPFMAALLGTAGHAVAYKMHSLRHFAYDKVELLQMMDDEFEKELRKLDKVPKLGTAYNSIQEEKMDKLPEYVEMLEGYQKVESTRGFHSTMHEQSFVLVVKDSMHEEEPPYLFTGQLDLGGYEPNGDFVIKDYKFKDRSMRPSKVEFDLDRQQTIYCAAVRYGYPACPACKPKYDRDGMGMQPRLVYHGPCEKCQKKIGTNEWPNVFPIRSELIWMRDFERYEKDQCAKMMKDPNKSKVPNPKGKGRDIIADIPNPKWEEGYKKGDFKGPGRLVTNRKPRPLSILMGDVLATCRAMRQGMFFRRPGDQCNFWCKSRESCLQAIEIEVKNSQVADIAEQGWSDEPFGE